MKINSVEIIDQRIARLKALIRRLRAERKCAVFAEEHIKMRRKAVEERNFENADIKEKS